MKPVGVRVYLSTPVALICLLIFAHCSPIACRRCGGDCEKTQAGHGNEDGAKGKAFFEQRGEEVVPTRFIGTVLDRTERHKTQQALVAAEMLATTGRLAASIAH